MFKRGINVPSKEQIMATTTRTTNTCYQIVKNNCNTGTEENPFFFDCKYQGKKNHDFANHTIFLNFFIC